jgi:hypothetical protein
MNEVTLPSFAGRYDNHIPTWFLAPHTLFKNSDSGSSFNVQYLYSDLYPLLLIWFQLYCRYMYSVQICSLGSGPGPNQLIMDMDTTDWFL